MELDIAFLANLVGQSNTVTQFTEASQNRQKAMNCIFWNTEMGQWLDYWLGNSNTTEVLYPAQVLHMSSHLEKLKHSKFCFVHL